MKTPAPCCSAGDLRCLRLALASRLAALYLIFVCGWGVMFVSVVPVRTPPPLSLKLIFPVNYSVHVPTNETMRTN